MLYSWPTEEIRMTNHLFRKLFDRRVLNERIYRERLSEPLIYNIISIFVLMFGNIAKKIDYDLVPDSHMHLA